MLCLFALIEKHKHEGESVRRVRENNREGERQRERGREGRRVKEEEKSPDTKIMLFVLKFILSSEKQLSS